MKGLSLILALIVSNMVVAAPLQYFNAVLNHTDLIKHVLDGNQLESIEHTMTFRCPGCFSFDLVFDTANGKQKQTATTKLNMSTQELEVTFAAVP